MHDLLITAIVLLIVVAQAAVFAMTINKIALFKKVIPNIHSFEVVQVLIPEDQIRTLSANEILENLENYLPTEKLPENKVKNTSTPKTLEQDLTKEITKVQQVHDVQITAETNNQIWIRLGNKEKKIDKDELSTYIKLGWQSISSIK